jgi:ectoine hydroxylase-related dioxygenase (phytanoyl-CoA dioxygenase family)
MVGRRYDFNDVPIDVLELTGSPGDVIVTHLHVFHAGSPNTNDTPRQMLTKTIVAA